MKISESYSLSEQIIFQVPQVLVLGPILYNILYLSDVSLIFNRINMVIRYSDDKTLYKACDNADALFESLRISTKNLFQWFKHNERKGNTISAI